MRSSNRSHARCCLTGDRLLPGDVHVRNAAGLAERRALLEFECDADGKTFLGRQSAPYPFHICRPFHLAGDPHGMATLYLQSCAGGIFEGDRLRLEAHAARDAKAHVTTSASTIVHSMPAGEASQEVELQAGANAWLEFLPDPLILFPGSRVTSRVRVQTDPAATVLIADSFLLHDPGAREQVFDRLRSEIVVEDDAGQVLATDRILATGAAVSAGQAGVTGAFSAQGSFYLLRRNVEELLAPLRAALGGVPGVYAGASLLPNEAGAFARILAMDAIALRHALLQAWIATRMALCGTPPPLRRK